MTSTSISIVIPALNEEQGIGPTLDRILQMAASSGLRAEIIVVDDGSSDRTGEVAASKGARVIRNPINGGYGLSLQRGIRVASNELIAIADADGTYPVEDLPKLMAMMDEGLDMAVGARQGKEYWKFWWKNPARIMFRAVAEFVAGRRIPDINSGLRIMRRSTILPYLSQTCLGFSFTTSITLILMLNGHFVAYRPIAYESRIGKSKIRHFQDTLRTAQIMTAVIATHNPVKLAIIIDLIGLLVAVVSYLLAPVVALGSVLVASFLLSLASASLVGLPVVFMLGCIGELMRVKLSSTR